MSSGPIGKDTKFTWFGHATFLVETPGGKRVMIDPWLDGNPSCPPDRTDPGPLDAILITHGHFDHIASCVELAQKSDAPVVCNWEIGQWLMKQGLSNVIQMNKGGTISVVGLDITMTHAFHSSGILDGDDVIYGGEPAGFIIGVENGFTFYFAGDTCVFGDMALIAEMHGPQIAILPIGDHFTMGPREAAKAASLLQVRKVIPMHYGTFDALTGTPAALQDALGPDVKVLEMQPGDTIE